MLSNEQLAQKARSGAQDAFQELWQQNKGLINQYAVRYISAARNNGLDLEDLKQIGFIALHDAVMSYDHTQSAFSSWLSIHLKGHMLRACGLSHGVLPPSVASLDARVGDDDDGDTYLDRLEDAAAQEAYIAVDCASDLSVLGAALERLPEDERAALRSVFYDGKPAASCFRAYKRGIRRLRNDHRLRALIDIYNSAAYGHTSLALFRYTMTSAVERAAIRREDILTRYSQPVSGK